MTQKPQTRRQYLQRTGGIALTATGATALSTTASAEEATAQTGILANGLNVSGGDRSAFTRGLVSSFFNAGTREESATLADRMRNEFTANTDAWLDYGNWVIDTFDDVEPMGDVVVGVDVVVTRWIAEDDVTPTTIDVDYDEEAEELIDLEWRDGAPEEPDYQVQILDSAAREASNDLQEYRRKFIAETEDDGAHELPDEQYVSRLAGKYISSMRFGEKSTHVLEMLVGEMDGM